MRDEAPGSRDTEEQRLPVENEHSERYRYDAAGQLSATTRARCAGSSSSTEPPRVVIALDTSVLVHAHRRDATFHEPAAVASAVDQGRQGRGDFSSAPLFQTCVTFAGSESTAMSASGSAHTQIGRAHV